MNKQLAKTSTTLDKNMTNTENLSLDNLTTTNIILPIYVVPSVPSNPVKGMIYIKNDPANVALPYELMFYDNGGWH